MCKRELKRDCETDCPIPRLDNDNLIAYSLICAYGGMMYNGEMIIAAGIDYALDLENISESERSSITRKIINYFATRSKKSSERLNNNATKQRHKRKF